MSAGQPAVFRHGNIGLGAGEPHPKEKQLGTKATTQDDSTREKKHQRLKGDLAEFEGRHLPPPTKKRKAKNSPTEGPSRTTWGSGV